MRPSLSGGPKIVAAFRGVSGEPGDAEQAASGLVWASWPDEAEPPGPGRRRPALGPARGSARSPEPGRLRLRRLPETQAHPHRHAMRGRARRAALAPGSGASRAGSPRRSSVACRARPGRSCWGSSSDAPASLPDELMDAFRRSGTVHILSVSGLHVGFILLIAHALLRSARVPPIGARLLSIPCIVGFAALIGPGAPVLRATAMVVVMIAARSMGRARSTLNAVGVAAVGILALDPGSALDLGFQLSYGATLGIVLLYGPARALAADATRPRRLVGGQGASTPSFCPRRRSSRRRPRCSRRRGSSRSWPRSRTS